MIVSMHALELAHTAADHLRRLAEEGAEVRHNAPSDAVGTLFTDAYHPWWDTKEAEEFVAQLAAL